MANLVQAIQEHLPFLVNHLYLFLFIGGLLEGLNTLILGGFLASFDQVKLPLILPLLIVAHTLNGFLWYTVGYYGGAKSLDRWGHKNKISDNVIKKITEYFEKYSGRAIMFAKFTFSLEIATMILAGSLKYNLKEFFKYNFYGSIGWVTLTVFVGYFFGESFKLFFTILKNLAIAIAFLGGAIALIYLMKILLKKHYIKYLYWRGKIKNWKDKVRDNLDNFLNNDY